MRATARILVSLAALVAFAPGESMAQSSLFWTGVADNNLFNEENWIDAAGEVPIQGSIDPERPVEHELVITQAPEGVRFDEGNLVLNPASSSLTISGTVEFGTGTGSAIVSSSNELASVSVLEEANVRVEFFSAIDLLMIGNTKVFAISPDLPLRDGAVGAFGGGWGIGLLPCFGWGNLSKLPCEPNEVPITTFGGNVVCKKVILPIAPDVGPLWGDFSADFIVDAGDIDLLSDTILAQDYSTLFDVNADNTIDAADHRVLVEGVLDTWFGDANLDKVFNTDDLIKVMTTGEFEDGIAFNSGWADGDWNGDGDFTTSDLVLALQSGGYERGPRNPIGQVHTVPEPTNQFMAFLFSWFAIAKIVAVRSAKVAPRSRSEVSCFGVSHGSRQGKTGANAQTADFFHSLAAKVARVR